MYSINNFLKPLVSQNDRNLVIYDSNGNASYTINPFNIVNSFVQNNLIKINIKGGRIITLDFGDTQNSYSAISVLEGRISILTQKTPLIVDKGIQNWTIGNIGTSGPQGPQGSINRQIIVADISNGDYSYDLPNPNMASNGDEVFIKAINGNGVWKLTIYNNANIFYQIAATYNTTFHTIYDASINDYTIAYVGPSDVYAFSLQFNNQRISKTLHMFPNYDHIKALDSILSMGKYRTFGDAFTYSPAEFTDMVTKANNLVLGPTKSTTYGGGFTTSNLYTDRTIQIWSGYPGTISGTYYVSSGNNTHIDASQNYPQYHGEGHAAASMLYQLSLITGATVYPGSSYSGLSYGQAVKTSLLYQANLAKKSGFVGGVPSDWPTPPLSNGSGHPTSFSGSNESVWLNRIGQAYTRVKPLFNSTESNTFESWHTSWVQYFSSVISSRMINQGNPGYLNLTYDDRSGVYADNYQYQYSPTKNLYYTSTGSRGPSATTAGQIFGNVYASYCAAFAVNYLMTGATAMSQAVKAYYGSWLFFSVYPDGTTAESVRNGDYRNPGRGAIWYQGIVMESLLESELMLRQRADTLMGISQSGGLSASLAIDSTKCGPSQSSKTLKLVMDRYLNGFTVSSGVNARYNTTQSNSNNLIYSPYTGTVPTQYGDDYYTCNIDISGMAQAVYGGSLYIKSSSYQLSGQTPLWSGSYSPARGLQSWFNGTGDQIYPGIHTVWSKQDLSNIYVKTAS